MLVRLVIFHTRASPTVLQLVELPAKGVFVLTGQRQPWAKISAGGFFCTNAYVAAIFKSQDGKEGDNFSWLAKKCLKWQK